MAAGRAINDDDTANRQKVAVINQAVARHFFPKGDAIGRTMSIDIDGGKGPWVIVGIARDTKSRNPRETEAQRMTYVPLAQIEPFVQGDAGAQEENQDLFVGQLLVRTSGDPSHSIADLRAAVSSVDPNLPLISVATMQETVSNFMTHDELISSLTGIFSLLALLLAAIGLYGVMSYNVVRRTSEIGIRIALGAQRSTVQWMVLGESLLLLLFGVGLGLPLTLAATRYIKQQLFGLSPLDPVTFAVALVVVSLMTLFAAWLPARRATRIDPMVALRCD
jgi:predicted permease